MEFRQEISNFVESYATNQFNKQFQLNKKADMEEKVLQNINTINELYRPHRHYRRKTAPPDDLNSRVQVTLLEYGQRGDVKNIISSNDSNEEIFIENKAEEVKYSITNTSMKFFNYKAKPEKFK